jgi:aldehyde:ferredoxin oxidoreductase
MRTVPLLSNRILEIDLTRQTTREITITNQDRKHFLGGKGLALKYVHDRLPKETNPLGPENVLAIMTGPLLGSGAPSSSRFAAVAKSPLTGIIASANCGGPFGLALKTIGFEGIILRGQTPHPIVLTMGENEVHFEEAADLWGKTIGETQAALKLSRVDGEMVIGPAGEHLVHYAAIASGSRFLGRGGLGAVMGSKNLKAIVVRGQKVGMELYNAEALKKARANAVKMINTNPFTSESYRVFGTNYNVRPNIKGKILPVRNFQGRDNTPGDALSGERQCELYKTKPHACKSCAILCGHKGTFPDGSVRSIPEYETTGLFGPNLEIYDPNLISDWNEQCNQLGMDTISTAVTLSYIMEAGEKGLLKTPLKFGCADGISQALDDLAHRRGFGDEAANGSRWLARKYGGEAFAIQVKGMEMAAYDPRGSFGQGLAYAVANRGADHLSATIFPLEVYFGFLNPKSTRAKTQFVRFFENLYAAENSLSVCLFNSFAFTLEALVVKLTPKPLLSFAMQHLAPVAVQLMDVSILSKLLKEATGISMSQRELLKVGERVHVLERWMNNQEGITNKDDTLPKRFLAEGRESDPDQSVVPIEKMLPNYYHLRGYNLDGAPTRETLSRLSLLEVGEPAISKNEYQSDILPKKKPLKQGLVKTILFILGRALQTASKLDKSIQKELEAFPVGYTAMMYTLPHGPGMAVQKNANGTFTYLGLKIKPEQADLVIFMKHTEAALMMLTGQIGTSQAMAEHRMMVKGNIHLGMVFTRCLNIVETYLFPQLIVKRILRNVPQIPFWKRYARRLVIYIFGVPFGL